MSDEQGRELKVSRRSFIKGLGTGANPNGPNPFETTDANTNSFQYLPIITLGSRFLEPETNFSLKLGSTNTSTCWPLTSARKQLLEGKLAISS